MDNIIAIESTFMHIVSDGEEHIIPYSKIGTLKHSIKKDIVELKVDGIVGEFSISTVAWQQLLHAYSEYLKRRQYGNLQSK